MRFLLDADVLSHIVRNPHGHVAVRVAQVGEEYVCTSIIVAAELRYGAALKGSPRLASQIEAVLDSLVVLPFKPPADTTYAVVRARLRQAGTPIGANDLLIAAQALTIGATVVTGNDREFTRVRELSVENWLRP